MRATTLDERAINLNVIPILKGAKVISQLCPSDSWHLFWDCHNLRLAAWVCVVELCWGRR